MKRSQIVEKLINEGFSEKTLVKFNDKQLNDLSVRIFGEATKMIPKEKTAEITAAQKNKETFMTYEGEVEETEKPTDKQLKALDKNKNKKIDSEDFKLLRKGKKSSSLKKENNEVKSWVGNLVNEKYHNFTKKGEIMELIQSKMTNTTSHGPNVKKGHNGIPEFMSYDAIKKSEMKEGDTKTKPKVKPTTAPTKPKKDNPYRPKPGKETNPKALTTNEDEVKTKPKVKPTTAPTKPKKDSPYRPKPGKETNPKALNEKKK